VIFLGLASSASRAIAPQRSLAQIIEKKDASRLTRRRPNSDRGLAESLPRTCGVKASTSSEAESIRSLAERPTILALLLLVPLCFSCANSTRSASEPADRAASDWYQLDQFAELHLSVGQLKTSRLKDGALVGQFEITNKTDQPITFKYKWLWLNSDGVSLNHGQRREKVIDLGADESRMIQSRTTLSGAIKPLVRVTSFSSSHSK
jgi:uncharacterized protein YcfL